MSEALAQQIERMHYLTVDEIPLLLKVITNIRDRAIVRLALDHGLRASEVGLLDFGDYFPGDMRRPDRIMLKRVKGSIGGDTVLDAEAAVALRKWVRHRGRHPGAFFVTRQRKGISRQMLHDLMKDYCNAAGIAAEKAHFHTLKHTCAINTLRQTGSIVSVQLKLGYAALQSAVPYAKVLERESLPIQTMPVLSNPSESGFVYFVETEDGQHVKIGFSTRPRQRFSEFGTLRPSTFAIRLLGSFPASRQTEAWLHEKFANDRDNGEWFRKSLKLTRLIAALI